MSKIVFFVVAIGLSLSSGKLYAETVWIDVRSSLEHTLDNIEGDTHIPHSEILEGVTALHPDKSTEFRLYCLSGGRAGKAAKVLKEAGYTNVENYGGISKVRELRALEGND